MQVIALNILQLIEIFHEGGYVHGCLCPKNILLRGSGATSSSAHEESQPWRLVGLSGAHPWRGQGEGASSPRLSEQISLASLPYRSPWLRQQAEPPSRVDDLVSWLYITVELLGGMLPWKQGPGLTGKLADKLKQLAVHQPEELFAAPSEMPQVMFVAGDDHRKIICCWCDFALNLCSITCPTTAGICRAQGRDP